MLPCSSGKSSEEEHIVVCVTARTWWEQEAPHGEHLQLHRPVIDLMQDTRADQIVIEPYWYFTFVRPEIPESLQKISKKLPPEVWSSQKIIAIIFLGKGTFTTVTDNKCPALLKVLVEHTGAKSLGLHTPPVNCLVLIFLNLPQKTTGCTATLQTGAAIPAGLLFSKESSNASFTTRQQTLLSQHHWLAGPSNRFNISDVQLTLLP